MLLIGCERAAGSGSTSRRAQASTNCSWDPITITLGRIHGCLSHDGDSSSQSTDRRPVTCLNWRLLLRLH
jgi:hypothetical protein